MGLDMGGCLLSPINWVYLWNQQYLWICHWIHCVLSLSVICLLYSLLPCLCWIWNSLGCLYNYFLHLYCWCWFCLFHLPGCQMSLLSEWNFLPTWWSHTLHIILSNPNSLISNIPNSTGLSPGTTRNLHLTTLSVCFNWTEHMPSY